MVSYPSPANTLGRSLEALMGKAEYSDFDSLIDLSPPSSFDSFLYDYYQSSRPDSLSIPHTPWTERLLTNISRLSSA
jgi:hypothetical protein